MGQPTSLMNRNMKASYQREGFPWWLWVASILTVCSLLLLINPHEIIPIGIKYDALLSALSSIGVGLIMLYASSYVWYEKHKHFDSLGILDAVGNREGGAIAHDAEWVKRASQARKTITLIGTTLNGWFSESMWEEFKDILLEKANSIERVDIYFLSPYSLEFLFRESESNQSNIITTDGREISIGASSKERLMHSLAKLDELQAHGDIAKKINVYFYNAAPLSANIFDNSLYLTQYLPHCENKECPMLTLDLNGSYCNGIKKSIEELQNNSKNINITNRLKEEIDALRNAPQHPIIGCEFCEEIYARKTKHACLSLRNHPAGRMIKISDNFSLMPTLGPLKRGHLLIISNIHYTAVGELKNRHLREFEQCVEKVNNIAKSIFCKDDERYIFFEHGVPDNSGQNGGCGIFHLHLHGIPATPSEEHDICRKLLANNTKTVIENFDRLNNEFKNESAYLLLIDGDTNKAIFKPAVGSFSSQYMRELCHNAFFPTNIDSSWDWRKHHNESVFNETRDLIQENQVRFRI